MSKSQSMMIPPPVATPRAAPLVGALADLYLQAAKAFGSRLGRGAGRRERGPGAPASEFGSLQPQLAKELRAAGGMQHG